MRRRFILTGLSITMLIVALGLLVEKVAHPDTELPPVATTRIASVSTSTNQPSTPFPTLTWTVPPGTPKGFRVMDAPGTPVSTQAALSLTPPTPTRTPTATLETHMVLRGETASRIAQSYGISFDLLKAVNGLSDPNRLFVGQVLLIPPAGITDVPAYLFNLTPPTATPVPANVTLTPTPKPQRQYFVNGMSVDTFVVMPENVKARIQQIFAKGQARGRDAHAFSKLGDSTIENPFFLTRFDEGTYNLGDYAYLQPVIDYYAGSFGRDSLSVKVGLHSWSIFDPMWAPHPPCQGNENMLACEFRVHNPALLFVRMGSNDAGIPDKVDQSLRKVVDFCLDNGVIPIMGTKADRFEGISDINNQIIRQIAADYQLPLWDFDRVSETIPGRGLGPDHVHLTTFYAHDWRSSVAFQTGHGVHSLTALMMLDAIMNTLDTDAIMPMLSTPPLPSITPDS